MSLNSSAKVTPQSRSLRIVMTEYTNEAMLPVMCEYWVLVRVNAEWQNTTVNIYIYPIQMLNYLIKFKSFLANSVSTRKMVCARALLSLIKLCIYRYKAA